MKARRKVWFCLVIHQFLMVLAEEPKDATIDYQNLDAASFTVELGIICDYEFSAIFNFNLEEIISYWAHQIQDLEVIFRTMSPQISFVISSVEIIEDVANQTFIELSRLPDNSTDLSEVYEYFALWIYITERFSRADVFLLVTGSNGKDRSEEYIRSACDVDHELSVSFSVIVFRSYTSLWYDWQDFAASFVLILGGNYDSKGSCSGKGYLMDLSAAISSSSYYISDCTEELINDFLISQDALCLKTSNVSLSSTIQINRFPFYRSVQEQCRVEYNNTSIVTKLDDCFKTYCYAQSINAFEEIGHVRPIYRTPCEGSKFCFRGECIEEPFILKNIGNKKCVFLNEKTNAPVFGDCPNPSKLYYGFQFLDKRGLGVYITLRTRTQETYCMTPNLQLISKVQFVKCTKFLHKLHLWDLIDIGDNSGDFIICHKYAKKCATVLKDFSIKLTVIGMDFGNHSTYRWNILKTVAPNKLLKPRETLNKYLIKDSKSVFFHIPVPSFVIELAIVCDMEHSEAFEYDRRRIRQYWLLQIRDLEYHFQTLHSSTIKFKITSIDVIQSANEQPFVESARTSNGNASLSKIRENFSNWLYENGTNADVVLLVTGSKSETMISFGDNLACWISHGTREYLNTFVLHSKAPKWHDWRLLAYGMATLLGGRFDDDTTCKTDQRLMAVRHEVVQSSFYFSYCSDEDIHQFLMKKQADCLTNLQSSNAVYAWEENITALTGADQCKLAYNHTSMSARNLDCARSSCYNAKDGKETRFIYPISGTPCGDDKSCFRGTCLNNGLAIRHQQSGQCIHAFSNISPFGSAILKDCPVYSSRFDEFRIVRNKANDIYLKMTYTNISHTEFTEKCITVYDDSPYVAGFDDCPQNRLLPQVKNFQWELIKVDKNATDFLICNKKHLLCASNRSVFGVVALEYLNEHRANQKWNFLNFNRLPLHENIFTDFRKVSQKYFAGIILDLAIFCDIECMRIFEGDIQKFKTYWSVTLNQIYVKMAPISKHHIIVQTLLIEECGENTTKLLLENAMFQGSTNLSKIAKNFRVWTYNTLKNLEPPIIAILVTGTKGNDHRSVVLPKSACKIDDTTKEYRSSIVLRIGMSVLDWCDEEFWAFGILLGAISPESNAHLEATYMESSMKCKNRRHFYSLPEVNRIRTFLSSKEAKCLRYSGIYDRTNVTAFFKSMTFSAQCQLFSNDSSTYAKPEEANCKVVNCYKKNGYKEIVVRRIYPFEFSTCGNHQECFGGACNNYGHQYENAEALKCLVASDITKSIDIVNIVECKKPATFYDKITYQNGMLMVPWINTAKSTMEYKCLFANDMTVNITFSPCPGTNTTEYKWRLVSTISMSNTTFEFLIYHVATKKCLFLDTDLLKLDAECIAKYGSRWRFFGLPDGFAIDSNEDIIIVKTVEKGRKLFTYLITIIPGFLTAALFACIGFIIYKRKQQKLLNRRLQEMYYLGELDKFQENSEILDQTDLLAFDRSWEFPLSQLKFERELGSGAFGRVVMATACGLNAKEAECVVAVKTLRRHADSVHFEALKRELKMLAYVGHHANLVNLLGACTKYLARNQLWIILEHCKYGSLRCYLLRHKDKFFDQITCIDEITYASDVANSTIGLGPSLLPSFSCDFTVQCADQSTAMNNCGMDKDETQESPFKVDYDDGQVQNIKTSDLLCWSYQIANGMDFLTTKRVLHGDLAARNVLLTDNNMVKICDFGFASELRKNYEYNYKKDTKGVMLPIKWMAIESLEFGIFSAESDCWSFGVLLWELFTLGKNPYPGMPTNEPLVKRLKEGYRMDKPDFAPSRVYDIMLQCWAEDKSLRPKFSVLVAVFRNMLDSNYSSNYTQLEPKCETKIMPALNNKEACNYGIICKGVLKRYHSDEHLSLVCCKKDNSGFRNAKSLVNLNGFQL